MYAGGAVSMSAAVVFARSIEPAGELLRFAREMLDKEAKDNAGRDAVAVVLKEPDGIKSIISQKWEDENGRIFADHLMEAVESISTNRNMKINPDFSVIADFIARHFSKNDIVFVIKSIDDAINYILKEYPGAIKWEETTKN